MSAIAGRRFIASRSVPERGGSRLAPSERGKNSYQLPYSARTRSTWTGIGSLAVTRSRRGLRRNTSSTAGASAAASPRLRRSTRIAQRADGIAESPTPPPFRGAARRAR